MTSVKIFVKKSVTKCSPEPYFKTLSFIYMRRCFKKDYMQTFEEFLCGKTV